jgi:hypothetical protein
VNREQAQVGVPVTVLDPVHFSSDADPLPAGQRGVIAARYLEDDTVWQVNLPGGITLFYTEQELPYLEIAA